ncbi:MAG: hypothetical protein MZV65_42625 [Chromatiales bacterium]|nr:hypothetical protein [Chromatiales bacterium]
MPGAAKPPPTGGSDVRRPTSRPGHQMHVGTVRPFLLAAAQALRGCHSVPAPVWARVPALYIALAGSATRRWTGGARPRPDTATAGADAQPRADQPPRVRGIDLNAAIAAERGGSMARARWPLAIGVGASGSAHASGSPWSMPKSSRNRDSG